MRTFVRSPKKNGEKEKRGKNQDPPKLQRAPIMQRLGNKGKGFAKKRKGGQHHIGLKEWNRAVLKRWSVKEEKRKKKIIGRRNFYLNQGEDGSQAYEKKRWWQRGDP